MGTTAPPPGAHSMHRAQMFGFLRDGDQPSRRIVPADGPRNGALQNLQRQGLGRSPKSLRPSRGMIAMDISPRRMPLQRSSIGTIVGPGLTVSWESPTITP